MTITKFSDYDADITIEDMFEWHTLKKMSNSTQFDTEWKKGKQFNFMFKFRCTHSKSQVEMCRVWDKNGETQFACETLLDQIHPSCKESAPIFNANPPFRTSSFEPDHK